MTPKVKHTAVVLGGAVVLASGAYALGSQTGDGAAQAVPGQSSSSGTTRTVASTSSTQVRPRFHRGGFGPGRGFGGPGLGRGFGGPGRPGFGPALDSLATKLGVTT